MASLRGKPFAVIPARDDEAPSKATNDLQIRVFDTFDQLEDVRRGMLTSTVANVPASIVLSEQLVVVYTGKGGDVMRLPPAALRGTGRGQVLFVANQGTGTLTLAPSGRDTLNGTASVLVNGTMTLFSDGNSKWHSTLLNVGPGAGLIGGSGIASITLDAQGRVTAVATATYVVAARSLISTADITLDGVASATVDLSANRTIGLANAGAGAGVLGTAGITTITLDAKGRVTAATAVALVPQTRQVTGASGLTGGGDLTADRTITMPNTGPGAGTIGSAALGFLQTITLDVQGRVTAAAAAASTTGDLTFRRPLWTQGTATVAGDYALSAGWGTTATVGVLANSRDSRGQFTVTSAGTGQAANPTVTFTFKNGTYGTAPFAMVHRNGGTGAATEGTWAETATTLVITFPGTPVATNTYVFRYTVAG